MGTSGVGDGMQVVPILLCSLKEMIHVQSPKKGSTPLPSLGSTVESLCRITASGRATIALVQNMRGC